MVVVVEEMHVRDLDAHSCDRQAGQRPDAERSLMRARHGRAAGDDVALTEDLVHLEMQIRKGGPQRCDDTLEVRGEVCALRLLMVDRIWRHRLVHVVEVPAFEHPLEPFACPRLQLLGEHGASPLNGIPLNRMLF